MKRKTINGNMSHFAYYANASVRQNGRIFPWGGFRLLNEEDYDFADNTSGLYCWCEKLINYPTEQYKAEITLETLVVKDRLKETVIETFSLYGNEVEVFVPTVEFLKISSEGFLVDSLENEEYEKTENLFFTFDKKYGGIDIIKLSFEKGMKPLNQRTAEDYIVLTHDGRKIPFVFCSKKNVVFVS